MAADTEGLARVTAEYARPRVVLRPYKGRRFSGERSGSVSDLSARSVSPSRPVDYEEACVRTLHYRLLFGTLNTFRTAFGNVRTAFIHIHAPVNSPRCCQSPCVC